LPQHTKLVHLVGFIMRINLLVATTYEISFYGRFPTCVRFCKCRLLRGKIEWDSPLVEGLNLRLGTSCCLFTRYKNSVLDYFQWTHHDYSRETEADVISYSGHGVRRHYWMPYIMGCRSARRSTSLETGVCRSPLIKRTSQTTSLSRKKVLIC
jgi:hypothetical protein